MIREEHVEERPRSEFLLERLDKKVDELANMQAATATRLDTVDKKAVALGDAVAASMALIQENTKRLDTLDKKAVALGDAVAASMALIQENTKRLDTLDQKAVALGDAVAENTERIEENTKRIHENSERIQENRVLLEELQGQVRGLGDGVTASLQRIDATKVELGGRIDQLDRQVMNLEIKVTKRLDVLDTKSDAVIAELARISTHLGVAEARPKRSPGSAGARRR